MKTFIPVLLGGLILAGGPGDAEESPDVGGQPHGADFAQYAKVEFLQPGAWWNLYFEEQNDPLDRGSGSGVMSVNAVKILRVHDSRPDWVQIAFPLKSEDHVSMIAPAVKARQNENLTLDEALTEWETTIDDWKVMWVNLDYVVHMNSVKQAHLVSPENVEAETESNESQE